MCKYCGNKKHEIKKYAGWTPELALEEHEFYYVLKVVNWHEGNGKKPQMGLYVGSNGFVFEIEDATHIEKITAEFNSEINKRLDNKVDKVEGSSLITNTLLNKLQTDYTKNEIDTLINAGFARADAKLISVTTNVLPQGVVTPPLPETGVAWLVGQTGGTTYTQSGGTSIPVAEGYMRLAYYNKTTNLWTPGLEIKLPSVALSNRVIKDGVEGVTQDAVYKFINGGVYTYAGTKNLSNYTVNPVTGNPLATYIFSTIYQERTQITEITYNGVVAGLLILCGFSKSGNNLTRVSYVEINVQLGINVIDLSSLGLIIPEGGMFGFGIGLSYDGRIGWLSTAPEADYHPYVGASTSLVLPAKTTLGGFGISFKYTATTNIKKEINQIKSTIDVGQDKTDSFVTEIGGLNPVFNPTTNTLTLDFTSGNQSVKLNNALTLNNKIYISFKAKVVEGDSPFNLLVGHFVTVGTEPTRFIIPITASEQSYTFELVGNTSNNISIGALTANNAGQKIEIKDFKLLNSTSVPILNERILKLENKGQITPNGSFNLDSPLFSLSRYNKKLTTICVWGDSLMANPTGGDIPIALLETITRRPQRLSKSNTIARRIYDDFSWNKPNWRRLDDTDWTLTGTWTNINDTTLYEPVYDTEKYHRSIFENSSATIIVPIGNENFSLIYRTGVNSGIFEVFVNGTSRIVIDTNKPTAGHTGNPYKRLDISDLNISQNNEIKITRVNSNTNPIYIWGGFYWTGNTSIVVNVAHGGHTLQNLIDQHIQDEVVDNKFDAFIMELTLMNDAARIIDSSNTVAASINALNYILDNIVKDKDLILMSCQPYGLNPSNQSINYYTQYPGMEELKNELKKVIFNKGLPFIDVFEYFKKKIINKGQTLVSGQGALDYTWDGQHQSELGMIEYYNMIKSVLINCPLKM